MSEAGDDVEPRLRGGSGNLLPALADRLRDARNRLISSPRFQRWAAAFPLTRPIARRRASSLFDLSAGFVYSQMLAAFVELELGALLGRRPRTAAEVAARCALDRRAARMLLDAAAALELAERRRGGRYGLGSLGAALAGNPAVPAMVRHHRLLYADLADPVAMLRGERGAGALSRHWPYATGERAAELETADCASYTTLMAQSQHLIAGEVLAAVRFDRYRHLMDVGGGDGTFIASVAQAAPALELTLFDLPAVAALAERRLAGTALAGRVRIAAGDFFRDPLPPGADLVTLVRVVHDHDDEAALALLKAVRRALAPGGELMIAEPLAGVPDARRIGDAYFGPYLYVMGSGRPRRLEELAALARAAGFGPLRRLPVRQPMLTQVVLTKPDRL